MAPVIAQDVGHSGPSFAGAGAGPTESKPESKLWFNDGSWWGSLWSTAGDAFQIHRLDAVTHTWIDTGVVIDVRPGAHADMLWDGNALYAGTHQFSLTGGAPGSVIQVLRYGYDALADTYELDLGFPATIGNSSTESMVIDKDSTGTVWAAWVQGLRVFVSHTLGGDDLTWSAPVNVPGNGTNLTADDVCSLVHFGNRIGVMWSDQASNNIRFVHHLDGAPDTLWSAVENALAGESDDHINMKADSTGRVFAVVKNVLDQNRLLVRATDGSWSQLLFSSSTDRLTRPILLLDEQSRQVHIFASGQDTGHIHQKSSPLDALAFAAGTGTVVMRDFDNPFLNSPTSTKQRVDASTGIAVLAAHDTTQSYWHHDTLATAGGGGSTPPVAHAALLAFETHGSNDAEFTVVASAEDAEDGLLAPAAIRLVAVDRRGGETAVPVAPGDELRLRVGERSVRFESDGDQLRVRAFTFRIEVEARDSSGLVASDQVFLDRHWTEFLDDLDTDLSEEPFLIE